MTAMKTANCEPTLNDHDVWAFCKKGYHVLEGVVSDEINTKVLEFLDAHEGLGGQLINEEWFVENVFLNPQAAGAVRSLLGKDFGLPIGMGNHRVVCPNRSQGWHHDGAALVGPELNHLQVFYYPQDCPEEMGPTGLVPGSHFLRALQSWMSHYGAISKEVKTSAPAGSIFITAYPIWHRRSKSTATGIRNMLKYCYWRSTPPRHDWIAEPNFNPMTADFPDATDSPRQQCQSWYEVGEMYYWLRGELDTFYGIMGGEGWPHGYPVGWKPEGFRRFTKEAANAPAPR